MNKGKVNDHIRIFLVLFFFATAFLNGFALAVSKKETPAAHQGIIDLNFNVLEDVERYVTADKSDLKEIPQSIQALNGKTVKITGYFLIPADAYYSDKPLANFAVSRNAYGCPCCSWGLPPTIFNTIIVDTKEGQGVKPPFTPLIEVTGMFSVKKEQITDEDGKKQLNTLFYIKDAQAVKKKQSLLKSILF